MVGKKQFGRQISDDNSWALDMRGQQAEHGSIVYGMAEEYLSNISEIQDNLSTIQDIDWDDLDISNHTQFSSIESYNQKLPVITIAIKDLKDI